MNNVNPKKRKTLNFGGHSKAQVVVKYFERVLGFDIESIKQEILLEDFLTVLSGKFFSSPAPGYPVAKGLGL